MCLPKVKGGLGFRDLKTFNLALLAKQGWRLHTNTNSLVHRVLKAKYFSNSDFLNAEIGNKPSFAWRSIMSAKTIAQHGYRWQVEDGSAISIVHDKWLSQPSTFRITSIPHGIPIDARVSSLIDPQLGIWKLELIQYYFNPIDALAILSIPISPRSPKDRVIWAYNPKGRFTVRSAYKLAHSLSPNLDQSETSNDQADRKFWKVLWSLNVSNKVKIVCMEGKQKYFTYKS